MWVATLVRLHRWTRFSWWSEVDGVISLLKSCVFILKNVVKFSANLAGKCRCEESKMVSKVLLLTAFLMNTGKLNLELMGNLENKVNA